MSICTFKHTMIEQFDYCFNSMPIDEFFDFELGALPYRSIIFHHRTLDRQPLREWSVTNFTNSGALTRETNWADLPGHVVSDTGRHTVTSEEPCSYLDNKMERYYPVKTTDNRYDDLYREYQQMAHSISRKMKFIGRCGTYQYLDMDQVINQSLTVAAQMLERLK